MDTKSGIQQLGSDAPYINGPEFLKVCSFPGQHLHSNKFRTHETAKDVTLINRQREETYHRRRSEL